MIKKLWNGLCTAFGMFSALPAPHTEWTDDTAGLLIPCFPVVGCAIGLLWYGAGRLLAAFSPPLLLHAVLLCLVPLMATGFLHLDGYLDVADAVLSRRDLAARQQILKDPHIGAFAAISLGVYLLLCTACAHAVAQQPQVPAALFFIPVFSRCAAGIFVLKAPLMSPTGYAALYRTHTKPVHPVLLGAAGAACLAAAFWVGGVRCAVPLLAGLCAGAFAAFRLCRALGGVNGDVSGAVLTLGEGCAFLCVALL